MTFRILQLASPLKCKCPVRVSPLTGSASRVVLVVVIAAAKREHVCPESPAIRPVRAPQNSQQLPVVSPAQFSSVFAALQAHFHLHISQKGKN